MTTLYTFVKLYKHNGYQHYVQCQIEETSLKPDRIWAEEAEIAFLSRQLREPKFGICHGVRTGQEVAWFRKYTGAKVIGTEISPLAAGQYEHTIVWDFHQVKKEWLQKFDFIYSNALDHSYDPKKCIEAWVSCLAPGGKAFVQWSKAANQFVDDADCANISYQDMETICKPYLYKVFRKRMRLEYHWFVLTPQVSLL
jgi:hypothetical protein